MAESCIICLDALASDLSATPCGHVFHCHCIHHWLATGKEICPGCNAACSEKSLIRLFLSLGEETTPTTTSSTTTPTTIPTPTPAAAAAAVAEKTARNEERLLSACQHARQDAAELRARLAGAEQRATEADKRLLEAEAARREADDGAAAFRTALKNNTERLKKMEQAEGWLKKRLEAAGRQREQDRAQHNEALAAAEAATQAAEDAAKAGATGAPGTTALITADERRSAEVIEMLRQRILQGEETLLSNGHALGRYRMALDDARGCTATAQEEAAHWKAGLEEAQGRLRAMETSVDKLLRQRGERAAFQKEYKRLLTIVKSQAQGRGRGQGPGPGRGVIKLSSAASAQLVNVAGEANASRDAGRGAAGRGKGRGGDTGYSGGRGKLPVQQQAHQVHQVQPAKTKTRTKKGHTSLLNDPRFKAARSLPSSYSDVTMSSFPTLHNVNTTPLLR